MYKRGSPAANVLKDTFTCVSLLSSIFSLRCCSPIQLAAKSSALSAVSLCLLSLLAKRK